MVSVRVPKFHPRRSTFHFNNGFPYAELVVPPLNKVAAGGYGLCGGMVWMARDLHDSNRVPPSQATVPPPGDPLHDQLFQRLMDSLDPATVNRYITYTNPVFPDGDLWVDPPIGDRFLAQRGRAWIMINDEWPQVKAELDAGNLSTLGLITVKSANPYDIFKNHQIVAWGYDLDGGKLTLHVYDPNLHDQDTTLSLDISNPTQPTPIEYSNTSLTALMFFRTPYFSADASAYGMPRPNLDALFIGQKAPTGITVGRSAEAEVTMMNVGSSAWVPGSHVLGMNPPHYSTWGKNLIPLGRTVQPGETETIRFTVTAPMSDAPVSFWWQMATSGGAAFGEPTQSVTIEPVRLLNEAFFVKQSVPQSVKAATEFEVSIEMRNAGDLYWFNPRYVLASEKPHANNRWGTVRVKLPTYTVAPDTNSTFTFSVKAPLGNNSYDFQWRMLDDDRGPFGDMTPNVKVTVTGGADIVKSEEKGPPGLKRLWVWFVKPIPRATRAMARAVRSAMARLLGS